jgi:hypothetical protein
VSKFFNVKITQGDSVGPYDIFYTTTGSSEYQFAKLYGTTDDATLIALSSITTGTGIAVTVPNDTDRIIVYNSFSECEVYITHYVITPTPTPTLTSTPTLTTTSEETPTPTPTVTSTSTPTLTETPTLTSTPTPTLTNTTSSSGEQAYFANLSFSTNTQGSFVNNQTLACNSLSCLQLATCYSTAGTSAYFSNYIPEVGDKLYNDDTLTTYYAGTNGYYIKLDTFNLLYVVNGIIASVDDCPTPTPTPTLTSTPTSTSEPVATPTLTTSQTYNIVLENNNTVGVSWQLYTSSFSSSWNFSFPLTQGQTGYANHSGIVSGQSIAVIVGGSGSYSINIYRNDVLLYTSPTASVPTNISYDFTTGFTTSDILRVTLDNVPTQTPTPTPTLTRTPTSTPTPTGTPEVTPTLTTTLSPLDFSITYNCVSPNYTIASGATGGSGQYEIGLGNYASENDALNNTNWTEMPSGGLSVAIGSNTGTYWMVIRDTNNPSTILAKSVTINCNTPTPTPTLTATNTPTLTSTSTLTSTPTITPTLTTTPTLTSTPTLSGCFGVNTQNQTWLTNPISLSQPSMGGYGWSRNNSTAANVTKVSLTVTSFTLQNMGTFFSSLSSGDIIRIHNEPDMNSGWVAYTITGKTANLGGGVDSYTFDVTYATEDGWDNGTTYDSSTGGRTINFYNSSGIQYICY